MQRWLPVAAIVFAAVLISLGLTQADVTEGRVVPSWTVTPSSLRVREFVRKSGCLESTHPSETSPGAAPRPEKCAVWWLARTFQSTGIGPIDGTD